MALTRNAMAPRSDRKLGLDPLARRISDYRNVESLEQRFLFSATITALASFVPSNGNGPAGVIIDSSGNIFGVNAFGGPGDFGTVFELLKGATSVTTIADFNGADGSRPSALVLDGNGDLFGITGLGGDNNQGTVFEIPNGSSTISPLASFNGTGQNSAAGLIVDSSGNLFGTTSSGGTLGEGTIFEVAIGSNTITTLANFDANNGSGPLGNLVLDGSGDLFGTTSNGGPTDNGTVFELANGSGTIATLASFNGANAMFPEAGVVRDSTGNLYGTTSQGGSNTNGTVFELANGSGTIATLASFGTSDGISPGGNTITVDQSGNIFGADPEGGTAGLGSIFELASGSGMITTLATFDGTQGSGPSGLTFDSSGNLIGAAGVGGANNVGTVFKVSGIATSPPPPSVPPPVAPPPPAPVEIIGGLDPNFGVHGLASHNVGFTATGGSRLQPDGKSVILGTAGSGASQSFGLTRYNSDGSLDTSFGSGGVVTVNFGGSDQPAAVSLLPSGEILVAGTATAASGGSQFALAEFTADGALDPSFGNSGEVLTSFAANPGTLSNDVAHSMVVSSRGTIYVGGSSDVGGKGLDFAVAAYNADGSAASFGSTGTALVDFAGADDVIRGLALQSNGELVAVGSAATAAGINEVGLARFLPGGTLDPHFGAKGKTMTAVRGVDDEADSVAIDPKGKIVVGGFSATGSTSDGSISSDFLVIRYSATGVLDRTFGGGPVITPFGQPSAITQVVIQSDGNILASGKTTASLTNLDPAQLQVALARYTPTGKLDTTFNNSGTSIISLSGASATPALAAAAQAAQPAGASTGSVLTFDVAQVSVPFSLSPQDTANPLASDFNQFQQSSQGTVAITAGGEILDVGNSGANTVEAAIVAMGIDLVAQLLGTPPAAVVGGAKGSAMVQVTEAGNQPVVGTITITLYASPDGFVDSGSTQIVSAGERVSLKTGQHKSFRINYAYPASLHGTYFIVADVVQGTTNDLNPNNNVAASTSQTTIAPLFVDLAGSNLTGTPVVGKATVITFSVANDGNTIARSTPVEALASLDGSVADGTQISQSTLPLSLQPNGVARPYHLTIKLPSTLPAGTYTLIVMLDPNNTLSDPNLTNNVIVGQTTFIVA
jgi:uncharacterized delta-60 repeat protein